jgi:hypothetical protein
MKKLQVLVFREAKAGIARTARTAPQDRHALLNGVEHSAMSYKPDYHVELHNENFGLSRNPGTDIK